MRAKVFSAIQPSGSIHIGNYFGAIRQWLDLQEKYQCIFSIANLHALTEPIEARVLRKNTLELAATLLALGLDYKKIIFFLQSDVPEHSELTWFLNVVTPIGDLTRMTQFKDKSSQFKGMVNAGLLNYPILMAADILLYNVQLVPVGVDQAQHLELTREIARRFNKRFGKVFNLPRVLLSKKGAKIMSLVEPDRKMSKSRGPDHYLGIFEERKTVEEKISRAVTDSGREVKYDPSKKAGISNLMVIYSLLSSESFKSIEKKFKNKGYADFKRELAETFLDYFKEPRRKFKDLMKNEKKIASVLNLGARKARNIASERMKEIRKKVGISLG